MCACSFRTIASEAYNLLRKHSALLLSLCHLMAGAAIPDFHADPEKALLKLQVRASMRQPIALARQACCVRWGSAQAAGRRRSCGWTWTTRARGSGSNS